MRRLHAHMMVLGTAVLTLGALACRNDLGTGPRPASPAYAKSGNGKGVVRTFHGAKGSIEIDHEQGTVRNSAGRKVKLDKDVLATIEKSFDALQVADTKIRALEKTHGFADAMERAATSKRKVRMHVDTATSASALSAPPLARGVTAARAPGNERPFASPSGPCFELEMMIYYGTNEYNELRAEYNQALDDIFLLGWGFDPSGAYGFDPVRYVVQLASWSARVNQLAYRIIVVRNTLDYLAIQYQLYGCWSNGGSDGGATGGQEEQNCHWTTGRVEALVDGVWVTTWEGQIKVCSGGEI